MRIRYMVEKPDELEMTARITMTAREWEDLRSQLSSAHPSWKLTSLINAMLSDARRVFHADEEKEIG